VKMLLKRGARFDSCTDTGIPMIVAACQNDDCDPMILQNLLCLIENKTKRNKIVNTRFRGAKTLKWKYLNHVASMLHRLRLLSFDKTKFLFLSDNLGVSALHCSARRGDIDMVGLLLSLGADSSLQDARGQDAASVCIHFPQVHGMLHKLSRKRVLYKRTTIENKDITLPSITLTRRKTTAMPMLHPMWLISLKSLIRLYGTRGKYDIMESFQVLRQRNELVEFENLPSDAEAIFVSHEWLSWDHPDPKGEQIYVLCNALERLREGDISRVDMNPLHSILYSHNFVTTSSDLSFMLNRAYVVSFLCLLYFFFCISLSVSLFS